MYQNLYQPVPTCVNLYQNLCQPVSTCVNLCQPVSEPVPEPVKDCEFVSCILLGQLTTNSSILSEPVSAPETMSYSNAIAKYESAVIHLMYQANDIWKKLYNRNYMTIDSYLREADRLIKEGGAIYNDFKTEMKTAEAGKEELVPKLHGMAECFKNRSNSIIKRLKTK